jgi:dCMP deaminase|tara:strand:- start:2508 stop:2948 length:441 start_codon:yes stop_codon:yes gene_type:complete
MANQRELDEVYMNMAHELSKLSKAERKKVGSIIVKDTQIISEGYNGTPKGFNNDCEYYDYVDEIHTKPEVLHAESNAITKLARSTNSSCGSTLYVTLAPCHDCAKLIIQAGIKRVVFLEQYRITNSGLALLKKAQVVVEQLTRGKV